MTKLISSLMAVLCAALLHGQTQKDVPSFGKVDKADLQMKECDFDKNAEAVVLFDVAELNCSINSNGPDINLDRHIRIKILKDKGLKNADIHIPFYSYRNNESIRNLTAQTYNLDAQGNVTVMKVDKNSIYDKKLNPRFSEKAFSFPDVKAGSIIEYKYQLTNADGGNWYFQRSIPVKYSCYRIDFPYEIEMRSTPYCVLPYKSNRESAGSRTVNSFSMTDIPALRDEPFISCDEDYLQRVETRPIAINLPLQRVDLTRTWQQIIESLMKDEDFGAQLKRNIPRTADLDEQLKSVTDPYRKMVIIHEYVRKNMEWNGYNNIWAADGVKSAWKDKKGTTGEINLILVNLLKDAGLAAMPVLVSTRENGRVPTYIPGVQHFNKVMAYVTLADKVYVLDATEKYTPARLIPLDVMTTEGMVIEKLETSQWGWKPLWNDQQLFKETIILAADVTNEGKLEGNVNVSSYDYSRLERLPDLKKGKNKFIEKYFTLSYPGFQADSLVIENEADDSLPLVQHMKFSLPVNASGDYQYFSLNLFTGMEKNPFVADNRFSDVFFGADQSYHIIANITIPKGYVFETLPRNIRMIMPDTSISITRQMAADKDMLSAHINITFKRPVYTVEEYPYFKEFYKKMFDLLNEQIAIRKEK